MTISVAGITTARSIASTTRSTSNAGSTSEVGPVRPGRSSAARASRAQKERAPIDPPEYDAGKNINGKKRHVPVDTQGLLMQAIIHAADIQERDGGVMLMGALFGLYPLLLKLYADSGYQGTKFQVALMPACRHVNLEIVKRSELHRFVVLPKRRIAERTIAWLNRCRHLPKDWECLNRTAPRIPALGLDTPDDQKAL